MTDCKETIEKVEAASSNVNESGFYINICQGIFSICNVLNYFESKNNSERRSQETLYSIYFI